MSTNAAPLPEGWECVSLSEVANVTLGQTPKKSEYSSDGDRKILKYRDIVDFSIDWDRSDAGFVLAPCQSNLVGVRQGDLLIGASAHASEHVGKKLALVHSIPGKFSDTFVVGEILRVRAKSEEVLPSWLYYYFRSKQGYESIQARVKGGHLTNGEARKLEVPIAPVAQQRRIVSKIEELFSELDDSVANLETASVRLQTYRQSLLKNAFEGRLTEQWRRDNADELESAEELLERIRQERQARYQQQLEDWKAQVAQWEADGKPGKKPRKPKKPKELPAFEEEELGVLPSVPERWQFVRLGTIAQIGSGMAVSKSRKLEDPVEVPYLRVANVQRGKLDLDEVKTMEVERAELEGLKLRKWDVLFNEGGDRDKLGRGWVWESQIEPCITQNHVFRASPWLEEEFHSKFISYWGNAFGRNYFEKAGKQTTNLASINKTVLSMFPVPIPPHEEQREIVRLLEDAATEMDALEKEISEALEREQNLRQSILKRALEGRLVTPDPDCEPVPNLTVN